MEIARHLSTRGAGLIFGVRNVAAGEAAAKELGGNIQVWPLDLAELSSVKAFAKRCDSLTRIDGVAMNAGVYYASEMQLTPDKHELM